MIFRIIILKFKDKYLLELIYSGQYLVMLEVFNYLCMDVYYLYCWYCLWVFVVCYVLVWSSKWDDFW